MRYLQLLERYQGYPSGNDWCMKCPWHEDSRPSLYVDMERGIWHCFSCGRGKHKQLVSLIMQLEHCGYSDALAVIAANSKGVNVRDDERREVEFDEADFDRFAPLKSDKYLKYLKSRKINPDVARKYDLRQGTLFDQWHNRVVYAIRNVDGKIVSIEGRRINDDGKRYYKSSGSKSSLGLFPIHTFSGRKNKLRKVFVVEGMIDALSVAQCGRPSVAMCSSELSDEQMQQIRIVASHPVVIMDTPKNGTESERANTVRRMNDMMARYFKNFNIVTIRSKIGGTDPNDLYRRGKLKSFLEDL